MAPLKSRFTFFCKIFLNFSYEEEYTDYFVRFLILRGRRSKACEVSK